MTGLDTNVIVRFVTQDDARQAKIADKFLQSLSAESPGFVSIISIVELVWVLETSYDYNKNEIEKTLEMLLRTEEVVVERADIVWQALRIFSAGRVDFADCMVERCGQAAGCQYTVTFDRQAALGVGMRLLDSKL